MQYSKNNAIENYILYIVVLLLPVLVLAQFSNAFVVPKLALVTFGLGLILIIKGVRNITRNSISFSASSLDLPVILLGGAYIISSILQTPNKMEAYFLPGTATIMAAGMITFFVVTQMSHGNKNLLKYFLFGSAVLTSLVVLLASTGVFRGFTSLPAYMQSTAFTPLGGPLPALLFLVAILPLGLSVVVSEKDMAKKAFAGVSISIIALASIMSLVNVLPGKDSSPQLPGFNTSWLVSVDSLKQSPLLGVGPGNYLTAFNRFRPISYNGSDLWATRFTSSQSFVLTTITETGILGGAAILLVIFFILKLVGDFAKRARTPQMWFSEEGSLIISLVIMTAALVLFPATPTLLIAFFIVLGLVVRTSIINMNMFNANAIHHNESIPFAARIPVLIATLPIIIAVALFGYQATRVLSADTIYMQALEAVASNDGRRAYDTLQKAINTNPYVDRYRVSYAQINLALANAVAQKEGEITDQDRETIAQLVQQAIREGKVAVALNPQRAGNWEVLASIYRAVMPLAQGADAFAVQTYSQAVALDPLNVNTRIALGGIYYAAKAYENAIDVFKLAVASKPDHANAHYNLAIAYRENGNLDRAIAEMGVVLSLVNRDSEDYNVATKALEDMQNKKAEAAPEGGSLTAPDTNEPVLDEPIDLPEDAAPPTPEPTESPSPTPTATPEESASPESSPSPTPLP